MQGDSGSENNLTLSGLSNIGQENFDIIITVTDGTNEVSKTVTVDVYDLIPTVPTVLSPADDLENTPLAVDFFLMRRDVFQNQFQVSTESNFNTLIADASVSINEFSIEGLEQNTEYFWRVRTINPCGSSDWSDVFSFITTRQFCATVTSLSGPIEIDDGPPSQISSVINFPYLTNISNVVVSNISGTHSYVGDLIVDLSYDGQSSNLLNEICFSNDDFNLGFSDESIINDIDCPPTDGRIYKPNTPLTVFNNSTGGGEWMLRIEDTANNDGGFLNDWTLDICYTNPVAPIIIPETNMISGCASSELLVDIYVDSGLSIPNYDVVVVDNLGNTVPSTIAVSSNDENLMTLTVVPDISSSGQVSLQVINADNGTVEFFSLIMLDITDSGSKPVVSVPANNVTYNFNTLSAVTWDSNNFEGDYTVEISDDSSFSNLVFSESGTDSDFLEIDIIDFELGEYFLRVVNDSDCGLIYSETINFTVDNTTSIVDVDAGDIAVYPNPSDDIIYLQSSTIISNTRPLLISADGKIDIPDSDIIGDKLIAIPVESYPEGIYFIQITDGDKTIRKRVVIID